MISNEYRDRLSVMQKKHSFSEKYKNYDVIKEFVSSSRPESIIDFGCAHGKLIERLKKDFTNIKTIEGYDPGVKEFSVLPDKQYDVLISNDVIEHIEPKFLDETLSKMEELYTKRAWLIIACYPAKKRLPDGRNAHLCVYPPDRWIRKINQCMPNSLIEYQEVIVKNPNKPIRSKIGSKQIMIHPGEQKELRLILRKQYGTT